MDYTKLMNIEKERLGFHKDKLVFIGMANFAKYSYCEMHAFLHSKEEELAFFLSYLEDRLYLLEQLKISKKKKSEAQLLKLSDNITWKQVSKILERKINDFKETLSSPSVIEDLKKEITEEQSAQRKGHLYEALYAKKLPRFRWNFKTEHFVLVGVADGIGKDFVYEFKFTQKQRDLNRTRLKARLQADTYGYFFKKPFKEIEIYIEENKRLEKLKEEIDESEVIRVMERWKETIDGRQILPLPVEECWKCGKCEFKAKCSIAWN